MTGDGHQQCSRSDTGTSDNGKLLTLPSCELQHLLTDLGDGSAVRLGRLMVIAVAMACLAAAGPVLTSADALASAPVGVCQEKSEASVVKVYNRNSLAMPLRCGTLDYGFSHIVARGRWDDVFDADIALMIARGEESADGTVYAWFDERWVETFRVIVNPGAIGGSGFRPQGVITAYRVVAPITVSFRTSIDGLSAASAGAARTDCLLAVPVGRISVDPIDG